jgi:uncharacterized membrane protein
MLLPWERTAWRNDMGGILAAVGVALYVVVILVFLSLAVRMVRAIERMAGAAARMADAPQRELQHRE